MNEEKDLNELIHQLDKKGVRIKILEHGHFYLALQGGTKTALYNGQFDAIQRLVDAIESVLLLLK